MLREDSDNKASRYARQSPIYLLSPRARRQALDLRRVIIATDASSFIMGPSLNRYTEARNRELKVLYDTLLNIREN